MAGKSAGSIYISLRADANPFVDQLRRAGDSTKVFASNTREMAVEVQRGVAEVRNAARDVAELTSAVLLSSRAIASQVTVIGTLEAALNRLRVARVAVATATEGLGGGMLVGGQIAAVIAVEKIATATFARAKEIQQNAVASQKSGFSFGDSQALGFAASRVGKPPDYFDSAVKSAGGVQQLAQKLKDLAAINDPLARVEATWKQFGADTEKILPMLGSRFSDNIERAKSWGFTLDEVSRSRIEGFSQDMKALAGSFDSVTDSVAASKKSFMSLLEVDFAGLYSMMIGGTGDVIGKVQDFFGNFTRDPSDSLKELTTSARTAIQSRQSGDITAAAQQDMLKRLTGPAEKQFQKDFADRDQEPALRAEISDLQKKLFVSDQTSPNFGKLVSGPSFPGGYGALAESLQKLTSDRARLKAILDAKVSPEKSDPFKDLMKQMGAELDGVKAKLDSVGKGASAEILAKSYADARIEIEKVNKELDHQHKAPLTKFVGPLQPGVAPSEFDRSQEGQVRYGKFLQDAGTGEGEWRQKVDESTASMNERTKAQQLLNDAIGKGYAMTRAAAVEAAGIEFLGDKYGNAAWLGSGSASDTAAQKQHRADLATHQEAAGNKFDADNQPAFRNAIKDLEQQISLQKALVQVQAQGAEGLREVTLAQDLKTIADQKDTATARQLISLSVEKYNADRATASAAQVAKLDQETAATQRLTAAMWGGAEAQRQAQLEEKYTSMRHAGTVQADASIPEGLSADQAAKMRANAAASTEAEIEKERLKDAADHQREIAVQAAKMASSYKDSLFDLSQASGMLQEHLAILKSQGGSQADVLGTEIALRDVEQQRLRTLSDMSLAIGTAQGALRAFLLDAQRESANTGKILYESLNSALDKVSGQIANAATGQKTSFGKTFQGLGHEMLQSAIKNGLQRLVGMAGKPDGSTSNPFSVRVVGGLPGPNVGYWDKQGLGLPGSTNASGSTPWWRRILGGGQQTPKPITFGNGGLLGTRQVPTIGSGASGASGSSGAPLAGTQGNPYAVFITAFGGSRDGTAGNPFNVVMPGSSASAGVNKDVDLGTNQKPLATQGEGSKILEGIGGKLIESGISSALSSIGKSKTPGFASGTDSTPAGAYMVGENGPEIMQGAGKRIYSNSESRRMLGNGGDHYSYTIDARGTDPVQTEMRVRAAIEASHKSAIANSVLAMNDRSRRVPGSRQ